MKWLIITRYNAEGNGTPLQYCCLENPMDRGAWQAAVYGVAKSRTWLSDFTSKKGNAKKCSNYCITALISHANKVMLKILQANSTWTVNFQMFKLDLEKAEEPEIKLPTSVGSSKKRVQEKHLFLLYWLCQSLWLCGSQQTVENS